MFENIKFIKQNDPAAKSYLEVLLCYPGLHALWIHKVAHTLYLCKLSLIPRLLNYFARFLTGIDIHPGAKIASGILIDHGTGVVIGETAEIGKGCLIYQGVTLGGTGKENGKRHPTLKENIVIGAGAKVLGNIIIESNVRIGAGSVVMQNVPPNCTVVGIPGRVVRSGNDTISDNNLLDHASLPDPVTRIISILVEKVDTLQREIVEISKSDRSKKATAKFDAEIHDYIDGSGI
jgi:serine O-acetyltransferase